MKEHQFKRINALLALFTLTGLALRLLFLNSDPNYDQWIGYITDEGRWTEIARNYVLFSEPMLTPLSVLHGAIAPVYQVAVWAIFETFGVDFWSARLFSTITGSALIVVAMIMLRQAALTSSALVFVVAAIAMHPDLVFMSRVAIPEMPAAFVQFLAFTILLRNQPSIRSVAAAGLITAIGIGMKATTMPIAFIFIPIAAFCAPAGLSSRIQHSLGYLIATAIPGLLVIGIILKFRGFSAVIDLFTSVLQFLNTTNTYAFVGFLFENQFVQPINFLLCIASSIAILLYANGVYLNSLAGRIYVTTAIWAGAWILFGSVMEYFPSRYLYSALIPLAIHIGTGLSLLSTTNTHKLQVRMAIRKSKDVTVFALALLIAISIAPLLTGLLAELSPSAHRLQHRLVLIAVLTTVLFWRGRQFDIGRRHLTTVAVIPPVVAILWFFSIRTGLLPPFFWDSAYSQYALIWTFILTLAGLLGTAAGKWPANQQILASNLGGWLSVAIIVLFSFSHLPNYLARSYTIRNASIDIGNTLHGALIVQNNDADALFLSNRINYSSGIENGKTDFLVTLLDKKADSHRAGYVIAANHELHINSNYHVLITDLITEPVVSEPVVTIYQLDPNFQPNYSE